MVRFGYRFLIAAATAACLMFSARTAGAETINFTKLNLGLAVTVGGTNASNIHGSIMAGEIGWSWAGVPPQDFGKVFYAYCVDLANYLTRPQNVSIGTSNGFTNGAAFGGAKAAWLFNEYAAGIHAASDHVGAAALQVAIWEAMYDSTRDLTTGKFNAVGTNSTITNRADQYLTSLYSATWNSVAVILNASASTGGGQDQITQVSEPSTLLFLGTAFLGMAMAARRTRRTA